MKNMKQELFEELYSKYYHKTYQYILSKVKNTWTAEDILSEVFIKIYKHRDEINDINKSGSWILKIAHNSIIDFYRKNDNKLELEEEIDSEAYYEPEYDNIFIREEFSSITRKLPHETKQMLMLRYYEDLKFREIAKLLNLSESTAKHKVYHALREAQKIYNYQLSM